MPPHLLAVSGCAVAVAMLIVVVVHNCLVVRQASCEQAWSDVTSQLSRRHAAATDLVACLRPHVDVDTAAIAAHGRALASGTVQEIAAATARLEAAIDECVARAEAHPQANASERFACLRAQLAAGRRAIHEATWCYDASVRDLDRVRSTLPGRLVAGAMDRRRRESLARIAAFAAD